MIAGGRQVNRDVLDRRQLFLRGTGCLIAAGGDLFHRAAQFFCRGRSLSQTACQLLGGRTNSLREAWAWRVATD